MNSTVLGLIAFKLGWFALVLWPQWSQWFDEFDVMIGPTCDYPPVLLPDEGGVTVTVLSADGKALARGIRARGRVEPVYVKAVAELPEALRGLVQDGDVLLTVGAGDIGTAPALMLQTFGSAP